jgi:hypothetical protein
LTRASARRWRRGCRWPPARALAALLRRAPPDALLPDVQGRGVSFAAANAAIRIYRAEPVADHIWRYGRELRKAINLICADTAVSAACMGPPFRQALVFDGGEPSRARQKKTIYVQSC